MLFLELFITFLKIGIFTFGGGYGMVALIQDEVVSRHAWLTAKEFTDILAVSQMTPGPIGINTATYAGYSAVLHAGLGQGMAFLGGLLASLAVILLPSLLMIAVLRLLLRHRDNAAVQRVLILLRWVVIGIIAAAAIGLVGEDSFGKMGMNNQFVISVVLCVIVFLCSVMPRSFTLALRHRTITIHRPSPILLIVVCGLIGWLVYA